ncbi:MAG: hypothetical protein ACI81P_002680 [Neolewinella sp.]|jgi:hypothetical protein
MIKYFYNERFQDIDFAVIAILTWLVPLFVGLLFRRFQSRKHRAIIAFAGFSFLMEHVSTDHDLNHLFSPDTNSPWYHLGVPVLFFLLTRFYRVYLRGSAGYYLEWVLPVVFSLLVVGLAIYDDGFYKFPSIPVGIYSLTGMILSGGYFIYLLRSLAVKRLELDPLFWVSTGFLLYYSGNFLLWLGLNLLTYDRNFFDSIYRINGVLTIILNGLFVLALLVGKSPKLANASTAQLNLRQS